MIPHNRTTRRPKQQREPDGLGRQELCRHRLMPVSPAPGRLQQDGCLKFGAASTTLPKQDNRLGAACENPRLGKLTLAVWQRMISKRPTQDGEKVGNKTTNNKEGCLVSWSAAGGSAVRWQKAAEVTFWSG